MPQQSVMIPGLQPFLGKQSPTYLCQGYIIHNKSGLGKLGPMGYDTLCRSCRLWRSSIYFWVGVVPELYVRLSYLLEQF